MNKKKSKKENIYNLPNLLSLSRIIISPFLIFLVFYEANIFVLAGIFIFAALTDFFDGYIARKYHQETNFGRRLDITADRIMMISLVLALFAYLYLHSLFTIEKTILILCLMSREILSAPFFLAAIIISSRTVPHARFVGKLTTTLQGFAFPMVILGWEIALIFVILTFISGLVCTGYYAYDAIINPNNEFQNKMDRYYQGL